uniref:Uncharacterized protein n=1 Tax=Arundo donax TaxID=35708 RepID=A0A0A8YI77_ARUDO
MPHQSNREVMPSPQFNPGSLTTSDWVEAPPSQAMPLSSMHFFRWDAQLPQVTPRPNTPSPSSSVPPPPKQAKAKQNSSAHDSHEWRMDSSSNIDDSESN